RLFYGLSDDWLHRLHVLRVRPQYLPNFSASGRALEVYPVGECLGYRPVQRANMLIRHVVVAGSALCLAALVLASLTSLQAAQAAPSILPFIVDRDDNAPGLSCTDGDTHDCTLLSAVQLDNAGASRDIQFSPGPHT